MAQPRTAVDYFTSRPAASEQIPARYNRRSALAVEVTSDTRTFDFDLTSD